MDGRGVVVVEQAGWPGLLLVLLLRGFVTLKAGGSYNRDVQILDPRALL